MNWLAHLALSPHLFEVQLGNLCADEVDLKSWPQASQEFKDGVSLHYLIDKECDSHSAFKEAKALLSLKRGVLKPVVLDIVFDYHLHKAWHTFYNYTFTQLWQDFLDQYDKAGPFPNEVASFVSLINTHDILDGYKEYDGIEHALYRIENRLKRRGRKINLRSALPSIRENEQALHDCFVKLYDHLYNECREWTLKNRF